MMDEQWMMANIISRIFLFLQYHTPTPSPISISFRFAHSAQKQNYFKGKMDEQNKLNAMWMGHGTDCCC